MRYHGFTRAEVYQQYDRLLEYHGLTREQVNRAALSVSTFTGLPGLAEARAHLLEVCPDLEGRI